MKNINQKYILSLSRMSCLCGTFLFAERKCIMYGLSEESLTIVGIILIVVGVAMIGWGFEWNQDITNDKRVGTVVRDIGVMVLATGIIFVMQRAIN
jgi:hypothetical protein